MLWECQNVRIFWNEAINRTDMELNTELPREPISFIWVYVTIATALADAPPPPNFTQSKKKPPNRNKNKM